MTPSRPVQLKIYSYPDRLGDGVHDYWGVTLYFCEPGVTKGQQELNRFMNVPRVFDTARELSNIVKGKGQKRIINAIQNILQRRDPIIQMVYNCIAGGITPNRCLKLSKTAGISVMRQAGFALYKYLQLEQEFRNEPMEAPQEEIKTPIPYAFFESVREFFVDQLADEEYYGRFDYERYPLNESTDPSLDFELHPDDFIFEIGEFDSAKIIYYGHYQDGEFLSFHAEDIIDQGALVRLLRGK